MAQMSVASTCPVFDADCETIEEFLERFSMLLEGDTKKKTDKVISAFLIRALPVQMVTDLQRRLAPKKLTETSYDELQDNLLQAHSVRKSLVGASVKFFAYKQQAGQTLEEFSKELRFLASKCNFEQHLTVDRLLRDVFIAGINSPQVLTAVLQSADKLSFPEAVEKAKMLQTVREDAASLHNSLQPTRVHASSEADYHAVNRVQPQKLPSGYTCMRCGAKNAHYVDKCYAKSLECRSCHKVGHIASVCRGGGNRGAELRRACTSRVHQATELPLHQMEGATDGCQAYCHGHTPCSSNSMARSRSADQHDQTFYRPPSTLATSDKNYDGDYSTSQADSDVNRINYNYITDHHLSPNNSQLVLKNNAELNDPEHFLY